MDGGTNELTTLTTVLITIFDVNDFDPVFSRDVYGPFALNEDVSLNVKVVDVQTTDADCSHQISYSIINGNPGDAFRIETNLDRTGTVYVDASLDIETVPSYDLLIGASDNSPVGARFDVASVRVTILNVDDNAPVFERNSYSATTARVKDPGTLVITVFAEDKFDAVQSTVQYSINSGDTNSQYLMDPSTGDVTTFKSMCNAIETESLVLRATDGSLDFGQSNLQITVINVNLADPQFSQPIEYVFPLDEAPADGDVVGTVFAEDTVDCNPIIRYRIVSGNTEDVFDLDEITGAITVATSGGSKIDRERLDDEDRDTYRLVVEATDSQQGNNGNDQARTLR